MEKDIKQAKEQYEGVIEALNRAADAGGRKQFKRISIGTGFSSKWLSLLAAGEIEDAGFKRIIRLGSWLHEYGYLKITNPAQHAPSSCVSGLPADAKPAKPQAFSFCSGDMAETPIEFIELGD